VMVELRDRQFGGGDRREYIHGSLAPARPRAGLCRISSRPPSALCWNRKEAPLSAGRSTVQLISFTVMPLTRNWRPVSLEQRKEASRRLLKAAPMPLVPGWNITEVGRLTQLSSFSILKISRRCPAFACKSCAVWTSIAKLKTSEFLLNF